MENSSGQWTDDLDNNNELSFYQLDQMGSLDHHQKFFTSKQILMEPAAEKESQQHLPLSLEDYSAAFPFSSDDQDITKFNNISSVDDHFSFGKLPETNLSYLSFGESEFLQDPTRTVNMSSSLGFVEALRDDDHVETLPSHAVTLNNNILEFQRPAEKRAMSSRTPSGAQDHVIAERNRREKINQHFLALSSIIPTVKKIDKASLLAGAIDYVKQLEEKVKNLEEKVVERTTQTAILVQNTDDDHDHRSNSDGSSSASNNKGKPSIEILPKVEASLNGNTILVRILQCDKRKGVLVKVLSQLEKFNLSVLSTSLISFAGSSLNITVTAQIEEGFSMTMKDLAKEIDIALS